MDRVDKYFKIVGLKIDKDLMRYMGMTEYIDEVEYSLMNTLGFKGIDNIIKDKTKDIIEPECGNYQVKVKILNWDVSKYESKIGKRDRYVIDNIHAVVDPNSTVSLIYNNTTYKIGDLVSYSDIDELNANYNTEDSPIEEDDIENIGYEIRECIVDWMYENIYPLTGVEIDGDVHLSNASPVDLSEDIYRIKNLMSINENVMVFTDDMRPKHQRAIEGIGKTIFSNYDYSKFKNLKHPDNDSDDVIDELKVLSDIDVDEKFVEEKDDIAKTFKKFLKKHDVELKRKKVDDFLDETGGVILDLKYHFNRPRPFQLNKQHNIKMKNKMMDSMKSPSFPSGHATQARLVGRILSTLLPELKDEIMDVADDVSFSRNMAKAHFPSDTEVGKKLGDDMFEFMVKEKKIDDLDFLS